MNQYGWKVGGNITTPIDQLVYSYEQNSNRLKGVSDGQNDNSSKLGDFKYDAAGKGSVDYTYDVNGNLVSDANKKISSIGYNYLNLTQTVTVTAKGTNSYTYDATGTKLKKAVTENGQTKTTLYLFGVYENDVLQYLPQEEGRLRTSSLPGNPPFVYDYMLKDHLGNVRMMLTEEIKTDAYPQLTFEGATGSAEVATQNSYWENRNTQAIDVTGVRIQRPGTMGTQATGGDYAMLTRKSTGSIGATKFIKVMAGDRIHTKVEYYYNASAADNSTASPLSAIIQSLTGAINGSVAASGIIHSEGTAIGSQLNGNTAFGSAINTAATTNPSNPSQQAPKAYLCVLFFNEQMQFDNANSIVVPVAYTPGARGTIDKAFSNAIPVQKSGYAYVYFTNESDELVYWDNFMLSHERGSLLEESSFYPFGLQMAGLASKAQNFGSPQNKYKFGGKEEQRGEFADGSGLELLDFGARLYDNQIGRWQTTDPLSEVSRRWTPYNYGSDNPIRFIDPDGMSPIGADGLTNEQWIESSRPGANKNLAEEYRESNRNNEKEQQQNSKKWDENLRNLTAEISIETLPEQLSETTASDTPTPTEEPSQDDGGLKSTSFRFKKVIDPDGMSGGWQVAAVSNLRVKIVSLGLDGFKTSFSYAPVLYFGLPVILKSGKFYRFTEAAFISTNAVNKAETDVLGKWKINKSVNLSGYFKERINKYMEKSGGSATQDARNLSPEILKEVSIHSADY